jgi:hypothetical protein
MKTFFIFFVFSWLNLLASSFDSKIGGLVQLDGAPNAYRVEGELIVEAISQQDGKLSARTVVTNPTFPQAFLIGPKNLVQGRNVFAGEFQVRASLNKRDGKKVTNINDEPTVKVGERGLRLKLKPHAQDP